MRLNNPSEFNICPNHSDFKVFEIIKKKDGNLPAVITIDGFLNQNSKKFKEWEMAITAKYPSNTWYHLDWQSESSKHLLKRMTGFAGALIFKMPYFLHPISAILTVPQIGTALNGIAKTWRNALKNSEKTGKLLSEVLSDCEEDNYILMGHSLGSRVIYSCLDSLRMNDKIIIHEVHLLGGAVSNCHERWSLAENAVKSNIYNYFSFKDTVLQTAYRIGTFENNPIGRSQIGTRKSKDINVTDLVNSHLRFKKAFCNFIQ